MCSISIFSMSVLEQILTECVQNYIGLHWFLSILFFTTKFFPTGICLSSNLTLVCLKAALDEFHMNWFPPLLSSLPSTSIHAPSHPYSYLHPLPLIEKQVTVQPVLSGHSRGMAAWPLHTGWLLCRFHRIGVLWKTIKIVPFCTTIDHFMHRNYLINTIGFICVVPLLVTVQYRLKTI